MAIENGNDESLTLKLLVFQMTEAGYTQDQIAAYLQKSKGTINAMLKPLQNKRTKDAARNA